MRLGTIVYLLRIQNVVIAAHSYSNKIIRSLYESCHANETVDEMGVALGDVIEKIAEYGCTFGEIVVARAHNSEQLQHQIV